MFRKYSILILILIITLWGYSLNAQVRSTDIVLEISPENPIPNQNVTAKLSSYVTDVNKAYISWLVNGERSSGGVGKHTFSFDTKNLTNIDLTAMIETIDGQNLVKNIKISPVNVDMLWEGYDSYVPPFYKGKAMVPSEGMFKVVAIPNINTVNNTLNTNNFSYTWEKDGQGQSNSSGWGKNSFTFKNSYLERGNGINVKISNLSGDINTEGNLTLGTTKPKILFYEKDPILGTKLDTTLEEGEFKIKKEGSIIVAIPYFISPKKLNSKDLAFDWYINDQKTATEEPRNQINLKTVTSQKGTANLKLIVNNTKALFTGVEKEMEIDF
ncbi:MAG: hypothetical protein QG583_323 [Patescibacteria group bacterium]|nr:hypothetical protein [Patescibacteria group bacterium]